MSNYPMWWSDTITVYNKYEDEQTHVITWYKTVINNAFWKYVHDKASIGETVLETEKIVCRIRKDTKFLEKYEWVQKTAEQRQASFTLGAGDIIVLHEVTDTINEYVDGQRSSDLIEKYKKLQGCMEIETVSINSGIGRGIPHYRVTGL